MGKKEKRRKQAEIDRRRAKTRNTKEYFVNFSVHHRKWMMELAERYKEKAEYPLLPVATLPLFYKEDKDKEVAAYVAMLIFEDGDFGKVQAFREMLGESPWKWFESREFVKFSLGNVRGLRTGGVLNWKIAALMDRLWANCHVPSSDKTFVRPIGAQVELMANAHNCTFYDILTYLVEDCGIDDFQYKIRLVLLVLGTDDGIGISVWNFGGWRNIVRCPIADNMRLFVSTWFPEWRNVGNLDNAIRAFGFKRESDFFYAFLGYQELQKRNPEGCRLYSTTYLRWWNCEKMKPFKWRKILPAIQL